MSDLGRATERTALAWQRTALSLIALAGVTARLAWPVLGSLGVAAMVAASGLAGWVLLESRRRYRHRVDGPGSGSGGRAPLALATATVVLAATYLVAVVLE